MASNKGLKNKHFSKLFYIIELATEAKAIFHKFLKLTTLSQKNRLEDYFKQWEEATSLDGPFTTDLQKKNGMSGLENTKNFLVWYCMFYSTIQLSSNESSLIPTNF